MKNLKGPSLFLLLIFLFIAAPLLADAPTIYGIGNAQNPYQPTVAQEYYDFLCDSKGVQLEPSLESLEQDFITPEMSSIISCTGAPGNYHFSINQIEWNTPISQVPSFKALSLFTQWQENPTIQELCSYLEGKVNARMGSGSAGSLQNWGAILENYSTSVIFPQADTFVNAYASGNLANMGAKTYSEYSFVNERGENVFSFTPVQQLLRLRTVTYNNYYNTTSPDPHDYYHRPTGIAVDGNALFLPSSN